MKYTLSEAPALLAHFRSMCPPGEPPSKEAIERVVEDRLDVYWLCFTVLHDGAASVFEQDTYCARAALDAAADPLWAEHKCREAAARAKYEKNTTDSAWAVYVAARDTSLAEYQQAVAPAYAEFVRACVPAAWRYLSDSRNFKPEYRGRS